ncbi:unnamed protein product [Discula destructiva]
MTETSGHTESWKSRACPGIGGFLSSYSLRTAGNRCVLLRRFSIWIILLARIIVSISLVVHRFLGATVLGVVLGIVLGVLNLFFIFWCLSMIDRAEGYRNVFCLRVGRLHLDMFLHFSAILHTVFVSLVFSVWTINYVTVNAVWFTLWALMAVYGFICTRPPSSAA